MDRATPKHGKRTTGIYNFRIGQSRIQLWSVKPCWTHKIAGSHQIRRSKVRLFPSKASTATLSIAHKTSQLFVILMLFAPQVDSLSCYFWKKRNLRKLMNWELRQVCPSFLSRLDALMLMRAPSNRPQDSI